MTSLRLVALMTSGLALFGCGRPPADGQARTDAKTRVACQQRAEQTYDQQNRGGLYSPQSQVNTPFSATYLPGASERGLSDLFAHDRMISDCVRNTGTETDRAVPAAPPRR